MNNPLIRTGDAIEIPGGYQFNALHRGFVVQRFWHQGKLELVEHFGLPDAKAAVLDLGCGSGVVSDFLAQHAGAVLGVDGNRAAVDFACSQFKRPNLEFRHGLLHELSLPAASYDAIYLFEVIEHLYPEQAAELLQSLKALLRPSGRIILTTPDYHSLWPVVEWLMDTLGLAPRMKDHQHVFKVTRARLFKLAADAGYAVSRCQSESGLAPFCSPFGWKFAEWVRKVERRLGGPFGMLLCAELGIR